VRTIAAVDITVIPTRLTASLSTTLFETLRSNRQADLDLLEIAARRGIAMPIVIDRNRFP
jgi:hypothetical protein